MFKRFLPTALLLGGMISAATLAGCQATATTQSIPAPAFTTDTDRAFSQLLGPRCDLIMSDGEILRGCTFYGVQKLNDKDFLHVKDFVGIDYMVRYEHITFIRRF